MALLEALDWERLGLDLRVDCARPLSGGDLIDFSAEICQSFSFASWLAHSPVDDVFREGGPGGQTQGASMLESWVSFHA